MNAKKLTIVIMVIGISLISIYDIWVYRSYGSDATISRILLGVSSSYPIVGIIFGISIGVLLGHLFWPQIKYLVSERITMKPNSLRLVDIYREIEIYKTNMGFSHSQIKMRLEDIQFYLDRDWSWEEACQSCYDKEFGFTKELEQVEKEINR